MWVKHYELHIQFKLSRLLLFVYQWSSGKKGTMYKEILVTVTQSATNVPQNDLCCKFKNDFHGNGGHFEISKPQKVVIQCFCGFHGNGRHFEISKPQNHLYTCHTTFLLINPSHAGPVI